MTIIIRAIEAVVVTAAVSVAEVLTGVDITKGIVLLLATAYLCDWKERS